MEIMKKLDHPHIIRLYQVINIVNNAVLCFFRSRKKQGKHVKLKVKNKIIIQLYIELNPKVMETQNMLYIVSEYASQGEIFGK